MHDLRTFWSDECGSIISAELVTIGTVVTVGAVVGLREVSNTVHDEMLDVSKALRNLNQSYSYRGFSGCYSMTAGSAFIDTDADRRRRPQDPVRKPAAPKTSDAGSEEPESEVIFLSDQAEAEESPFENNAPVTPADDKL